MIILCFFLAFDLQSESMGSSFHCQDLQYSLALRSIFGLDSAETTVIEVIGPIGLAFCILNIAILMASKPLRQPPSDILIIVNALASVKILCYYTTLKHSLSSPLPEGFNQFCQWTGAVNVYCQCFKLSTSFSFFLYYLYKIKNPLRAWKTDRKEIYILNFLISIGLTIVVYLTNYIGVSIYGYCSFRFSHFSQFGQLVMSTMFLLSLVVSSYSFLKYLKKVGRTEISFRKYFRYYFNFVIIFTICEVITVIAHLIIAFTCQTNQYKHLLDICQIIDKLSIITEPSASFFVLVSHPSFKKIFIFRVFRIVASIFNKKANKQEENPLSNNERNSVLIQLKNLGQHHMGYIGQLKNRNRASLLATILAALVLQQQEKQLMNDRQSALQDLHARQSQTDLYPTLNFHQETILKVNEEIALSYYSIFMQKLPCVCLNITFYAFQIFDCFRRMDSIYEINDYLLPDNNYKQILKDASNEGDGGRSGQFFFFNYDRSFILKTLNLKEKSILIEKLHLFYNHFLENPNSFIVKIYSLFTVKHLQTQESTHFMLMGNILRSISRNSIVRIYDLKGSSHHRQVLKNESIYDQIVKSTLKDTDFIKQQQKIWLNLSDCKEVQSLLMNDAIFLRKCGLIDYSFLVVKLNFKIIQQQQGSLDCLKYLKAYKSNKQPHIGYVFGIIDYLQTWNFFKKSQKWYKSMFTQKETISSQDPQFYFERFSRNVIKEFFP